MYINQMENNYEEIITDMDVYETRYYQEALEIGIPAIEEIRNFSVGLEDITLENFRVGERIIRWHDRNFGKYGKFEQGVKYLGISF